MTFERVRAILAAELDLDVKKIRRETDLRAEYGISSLEYFGAILALEREVEEDDELDADTIAAFRTVGQIADYMERRY